VTPLLISLFRRQSIRAGLDDGNGIQPLISVGLIGLSWQLCLLVPAVAALFVLPSSNIHPPVPYSLLTGVLLGFLAMSRLGPFAYALVEQQLVQVGVPADQRIEFSGTEMALISFAELMRWGLTGIFGSPEQFKGVAAGSFGAIAIAMALFWWWTRHWRERLGNLSTRDIRVTSP
jgi:iron-regulated transporter 1